MAKKLYYYPKKFSGSWNFGPSKNDNLSVEEVAKEVIYYFGSGKIVKNKLKNFGHEAALLQLNCDKASNILELEFQMGYQRNNKKSCRVV